MNYLEKALFNHQTYLCALLLFQRHPYWLRLVKASLALAQQFKNQGHEVQVVSMENCDIPMVGRGSVNPDQLTDFQQLITTSWASSDCILFALPEYNWTNGGEFVNMIHQLGGKAFAHLFHEKTFALVGVSSGRGGRLPAIDAQTLLNKIISFTGQYSIISPKIWEAHEVHKNVDAEGNSTGNAMFDGPLADFVQYTSRVAANWSAGVNVNA